MLSCTGKRELPQGRDRRAAAIIFTDEEASSDTRVMSRRGGDSDDGKDSCKLVVKSCTSEESRDGGDYTVYVLRCVMVGFHCRGADEPLNWDVRRRYSEFHELHSRLKALGTVKAELPSKNPLSKLLSKVVKSREIGLQDYLNAVLEHCNDDQCVLLSKFLKVGRQIKALQSTSQAGDSFSVNSSRDMSRRQDNSPPPRSTGDRKERDGQVAASDALWLAPSTTSMSAGACYPRPPPLFSAALLVCPPHCLYLHRW